MSRRGNNEGSITQRGDGRWMVRITLVDEYGRREQRSFYAATKEEARKKLTDLKNKQDNHLPVHFERMRVAEWLDTWLEEFIRPRRRPSTWASYHKTIHAHVLPHIGKLPLAGLPPARVQHVINHLLEAGKRRTAAYVWTILRTAFKRAVKLRHMPHNPVDALDGVSSEAKETPIYTPQQAETFLKAAEGHRLEALFQLALSLGLRKGELSALSVGDIDLDSATLTVRRTLQRLKLPGQKKGEIVTGPPKSKKSQRDLPLPDFLVDHLRRHLARREENRLLAGSAWQESSLLFTTMTGTAIEPRNLVRAFLILAKNAKLPRIRFHDLRHTCGSFLFARGVKEFTIQEILGHSQLSTTKRYTRVDLALKKAALESIGPLLKASPSDNKKAHPPRPKRAATTSHGKARHLPKLSPRRAKN